MKVLVTGASGFVGTNLCSELQLRGHEVTAAVRRPGSAPAETNEAFVGDINETTDWTSALRDQDAVIHLAARVHVMAETAADPLAEFRRVNAEGTLTLAQAAIEAGISKFIFLSSIKANGEATKAKPFSVDDEPRPQDAYGISKLEAEVGIAHLAEGGPTKFASVRTPLVYGPGVGGNFLRLIKIVDRGMLIPLASVDNRRAMVSVWNLSDLISHLLISEAPPYQLVMLSDKDSLSTPDLIRAIGRGLGKQSRLVRFPVALLGFAGTVLRKRAEIDRLVGSLEVTTGSTFDAFTWAPPLASQDAIDRTARAWLDSSTELNP